MPRNQVQGFVFGLLMSYVMAYGMEVYMWQLRKVAEVFAFSGLVCVGQAHGIHFFLKCI